MLFPGDITEAYRLFLLLLYLFRPIRRNPSMDFEYAVLNLVSNLQILREIEEKSRAAPGNLGRKNGAAAYQIIVGHGAWPQSFYHNRNKKRRNTELCFCLSCMRSQQLLKLCFSQRTLPHHHLNTVLAAAPGRFVNRRIQSI